MRSVVMLGLAVLAGLGCEGGHAVVVDLVTDFEPGVEFASVRTEILHSSGGDSATVSASFGDDFLAGVRIAELDGVSEGSTTTRVFLVDAAGETLIQRTVIATVASDTGLTVLATRSCLGLVCPRATDAPASSECVGGQCVDERCTVESSAFCGDPGCTIDADCAPGPVACARQVCVAGACLAEGLDGMCAGDEYCDVSTGCRPRPTPPMDAGFDALLDSNMDAAADADAADAPADTRIDVSPPGPGDFVLVAGATLAAAPGIYAGAPDVLRPGARRFPMYFTGPGNTLYLFGGRGYDVAGTRGNLDDLWRFDVATGEWTFLGGQTTAGGGGDWGVMRTPAATNWPSARNSAVMVTDSVGNAWLYGGTGIDSAAASGNLADLWRYEVASGTWTWMAGPSTIGAAPVFGTEGTPAAGNQPGQRLDYGLFVDASNDVWLFGGKEVGIFGWRNDLWRYQSASGLWTWFGGYNDAASYGTRGVPTASNTPGRRHIVAWGQDGTSSFYIFGGEGNDAMGGEWVLADLWRYEPATDLWTWVTGPETVGLEPIYGTRGVPDDTSRPGGRFTGRLSVDAAGRVWVHGGFGRISGGDNALSDLWIYDPSADQWTWVAGGSVGNEETTLGAGGGPGSREGQAMWFDAAGSLFVFGGLGYDTTGARGDMADLWQLTLP